MGNGTRTIVEGDAICALTDALADLMHVYGGIDQVPLPTLTQCGLSAQRHYLAEVNGDDLAPDEIVIVRDQ